MSCENCYKGFVLPGEPKGTMVGPDYFAAAPSDATQPSKAIVLLTDIFGLPLPNPKIIADHLAEHVGVDVWVPDYFNGKPPMDVKDMEPFLPDRAGVKMPFSSALRLFFNVLYAIPRFIANRPTVVSVRVQEFIRKIKAEKGYERIGAVGYCYGGAMVCRLGATNAFNTIVTAHPAGLSAKEIRAIKVPTSWLLADEDMGFSDKDVKTAKTIFRKQDEKHNRVDYEFRVWEGTAHGFAVRPNLSVPEVKAGYEGGLEQTVAWFKKTL